MEGKPEERRPRKLHVMLVDDDAFTLNEVAEWLRAAGHRVTTRSEALGTTTDIVKFRPDLVLLEVMMAGLRGDDLARLIKRHPATRNTPVVLHSSLSESKLRPLIMTTSSLGAIEKTSNSTMFMFAFNCLIAKLRLSTADPKPSVAPPGTAQRTPPATSGTYRAASSDDDAVREFAAQARFNKR